MPAGPVAGVLQGYPGEEPLHGHALVPALLRDVPGLLRTENAAEELTCAPPPPPLFPIPYPLFLRYSQTERFSTCPRRRSSVGPG